MDHTKLIADIKSEIETATTALEIAKDHAATIPDLEATIERLRDALKSLTAPQTPSGRKRIGEGAAKRAKATPRAKVPVGEAATAPQCVECRGLGTMDTATTPCTVAGCDAHVCGACWPSHNARWHREAA